MLGRNLAVVHLPIPIPPLAHFYVPVWIWNGRTAVLPPKNLCSENGVFLIRRGQVSKNLPKFQVLWAQKAVDGFGVWAPDPCGPFWLFYTNFCSAVLHSGTCKWSGSVALCWKGRFDAWKLGSRGGGKVPGDRSRTCSGCSHCQLSYGPIS